MWGSHGWEAEVSPPKPTFYSSIGELVKLDHGRITDLVAWQETELDAVPITKVYEWVLEKMGVVSKVLGVSFDRMEQAAWELFVELERRSKTHSETVNLRGKQASKRI